MKRSLGFSLIEVVCAVAILAIGLVGMAEAISVALRSSKEAELRTTAALLAAGRLETLRAEGYLIAGEDEGEFTAGFSQFRWRETVEETSPEGLHEVTVTVESTKTDETLFELKTLLFDAPLTSTLDLPQEGGGQDPSKRGSPLQRARPSGGTP